jgi:hypothetical protein
VNGDVHGFSFFGAISVPVCSLSGVADRRFSIPDRFRFRCDGKVEAGAIDGSQHLDRESGGDDSATIGR